MSEHHPHPRHYALDVDALPVRLALLEYCGVLAETLRRVVTALDEGEHGRGRAIEELAVLAVLIHYLRRRLAEPAELESDGETT